MNREGLKRLRIITMMFAVMISMTGLAAAFDVDVHQASPNQANPAPGLLDLNQGASVTLSLLTKNFNSASIPGSYPRSATITCAGGPGTCTPSDVVVTIIPTGPVNIETDPSTLVDNVTVTWTGATDPDGTLYLLTVNVGPGTPNNEVGSASRTIKGHKETPPCTQDCTPANETWIVEWFHTQPDQYKEFVLPGGQNYLVTTGFYAPEAVTHIWDNQPAPIAVKKGDRLKYWHNTENITDLYINNAQVEAASANNIQVPTVASLRLYGTFGEGAGDLDATDPVTGLKPENPPYTDPLSPFFPQAPQSPVKDFVTFNPAILLHNGLDGEYAYPQLTYLLPDGNTEQSPKEKVFKRMNYQKDWFKDDYHNQANGRWDVVIEKPDGTYVTTLPLDDEKAIHAQLELGNRIREQNNDPNYGDTYAPAIVQEFTYMTLSTTTMPILVQNGSHILVPMASYGAPGLNSFGSIKPNDIDAVKVESEKTLNMDIDGDGIKSSMDTDGTEVSGDEKIVLVLDNKDVKKDDNVQFFDNAVNVTGVWTNPAGIDYKVCDNEGGTPSCSPPQSLGIGQVAEYRRGQPNSNGPFYIKLVAVNIGNPDHALIEVGRLFGNTPANIGKNPLWNEKAFMVQDVFYNIVGIKAKDDTFKYLVVRQKLPKKEIKLYGKHLKVWREDTPLPELPPFNIPHLIVEDVLDTQSKPTNILDTIGNIVQAEPLLIGYISETKEPRFLGELKEIFNETGGNELWNVEWFNTRPRQYTEFVIAPQYEGFTPQKYLVTTGFNAPEAATHIWNETGDLLKVKHGDRLKFWFDPADSRALFVNDKALRLYGTFGEGAGDLNAKDPANGLAPENPPYTDVNSPFFPQAPQSPVKDFVTFNPAILLHNGLNGYLAYPQLIFLTPDGNTEQSPKEKVFKRMNYQKDWFKDDYHNQANGRWDVVIEDQNGNYVTTLPLDDEKAIHAQLELGNRIREHNNDPNYGDTYAPAIVQEFTYMTLDTVTMPMLVQNGSHILVPMASYGAPGLNSFGSIKPNDIDAVKVESEKTLNMDIDGDGIKSSMDTDGTEVSGDEKIVLVLDNKDVKKDDNVQFFDNAVNVTGVWTNPAGIDYKVCDNEGGTPSCSPPQSLGVGQVAEYRRGQPNSNGPFYIKLVAVNIGNPDHALIEVGRLFGNTPANIGKNPLWNEKAFMVQEVFYNIVGIKAKDDTFKYLVVRQKLPETPIKLYGKHLKVWTAEDPLPELPPFNMEHVIMEDVLDTQSKPKNQQDKIGKERVVGPLTVTYTTEGIEARFKGELKEIYSENETQAPPPPPTGTCLGDLSGDGKINFTDFTMFAAAYGTQTGDPNFNPDADLSKDGKVNFTDFTMFAAVYGTNCQP